jgi:hypothetical protein
MAKNVTMTKTATPVLSVNGLLEYREGSPEPFNNVDNKKHDKYIAKADKILAESMKKASRHLAKAERIINKLSYKTDGKAMDYVFSVLMARYNCEPSKYLSDLKAEIADIRDLLSASNQTLSYGSATKKSGMEAGEIIPSHLVSFAFAAYVNAKRTNKKRPLDKNEA